MLKQEQISSWKDLFKEEKQKDYYINIINFLQEDAKNHKIHPSRQNLFTAFNYCPFEKTKVLILGQDPYINPNQAHGLSFSVPQGITIPPSLMNIFKELKSDLNIPIPNHGCLMPWAQQGVLLLNSTLTVRAGESNSHKDIGWQIFTDKVISVLNEKSSPIVFILWGAFAKRKKELIFNNHHLILDCAHPSPLSAHNGFFGCKHFSKTNQFLKDNGIQEIDWSL